MLNIIHPMFIKCSAVRHIATDQRYVTDREDRVRNVDSYSVTHR